MLNIMWRNMKWRLKNPISILVTILQPLLWLVLYSAVASQTMQNMGVGNYTAFVLPGIIFLVIFSVSCSGGIINFIMKSSGSFYRNLIAPVRRSSIVLGQMLEVILVSFMEVGILFAVSLFFLSKDIIQHHGDCSHDTADLYDSLLPVRACLFRQPFFAK